MYVSIRTSQKAPQHAGQFLDHQGVRVPCTRPQLRVKSQGSGRLGSDRAPRHKTDQPPLKSKVIALMFKLNTILAPVDFSNRSAVELDHAVDIAARFGAKLVVLHVIPTFGSPNTTDPAATEAYSHEFSADIENGIRRALQSLVERVAPDFEAEPVVSKGNPAEIIEEVAADRNADLIVMPTTGQGRFRSDVLGSVTAKVLEDVSIPVLTGVHVEDVSALETHAFKRIACLIHPEEGYERIPRWASGFAAAYEANLIAVAILAFRDGPGATASTPEPLREEAMEDARQLVEDMLQEQDVRADVVVLGGKIEEVLPSYLEEARIDLLVMGRRPSQKVLGLFGMRDIGNILQSVPCPTISI
jgi:nucleotide-binding universal stress UspA family protein